MSAWHENPVLLLTRRISQLGLDEMTHLNHIAVRRIGQHEYQIFAHRQTRLISRVRLVVEVLVEDRKGRLKTRKVCQPETLAALQRRVAEIALTMQPEAVLIPVIEYRCGVKQPPLFAAI